MTTKVPDSWAQMGVAHHVGRSWNGPEVRADCSCGWTGYWTVDAPDTVRDHQEAHLREVSGK